MQELYLADCPAVGPSERRVLVHASIFEKFMERFKAYRPLLMKIKGEYDSVLHKYSNQLHVLNAQQFRVSNENVKKTDYFLDIKNAACDEINSLRKQVAALTKDKDITSGSTAELTTMVAHWKVQASTRVPLVNLQMAEQEVAQLKKEVADEKAAHAESKKENDSLSDEIAKLKQDKQTAARRMKQMTPRPDWDDMLGVIPDLHSEFPKCNNSGDKLDAVTVLLKAQQTKLEKLKPGGKKKKGSKDAKDGDVDYFSPLGVGKEVPKFLQTNSRVVNKHMTKGVCEDTLKECWSMKEPPRSSPSSPNSMLTALLTQVLNLCRRSLKQMLR